MHRQLRRVLSASGLLLLAISVAAQTDFEDFRKKRTTDFSVYKKTLEEQFSVFKMIYRQETEKFEADVSTVWDDPELSTRTTWIEYSGDLQERTKVDFQAGTITIEIANGEAVDVSPKALRALLTELVTKNKAEAFADDVVAQAIERRLEADIDDLTTAEVEPNAILLPYLTGMLEAGTTVVNEIVDHMLSQAASTSVPGKDGRTVRRVEFPLTAPERIAIPSSRESAPDQLPRRARSFWPEVSSSAEEARVERTLIYAVIETESAFNPLAKSRVPAYGLMQIVPETAGRDAIEKLDGKAQVLSPSYLYNSGNNIRIGATYLNLLYYKYFGKTKDPLSRLYCSIAAYNTGPGNVARLFTGQMNLPQAVDTINRMRPEQVYSMLEAKLPSETRAYLKRVSARMKKYKEMGI